jgi:hypothetical protein
MLAMLRQAVYGRLALPSAVKHWSLTTLWEKLIKIRAKVVHRARCVMFQMAAVAVPRDLFPTIPERIQWFGVPAPLAGPYSSNLHTKRGNWYDSREEARRCRRAPAIWGMPNHTIRTWRSQRRG